MRRAKLQPNVLAPAPEPKPATEAEGKRTPLRQAALPPIGDRMMVAPPQGKPEHVNAFNRRNRPKTGLRQTMHVASPELTGPPMTPTPPAGPRRSEDKFFRYSDFVGKTPVPKPPPMNFPDIMDGMGTVGRSHLRVRAQKKELTIITEFAPEPARRPNEALNNGRSGRSSKAGKRNRTPTGDGSTENAATNEKSAKVSGSHGRLPPLEKMLKRRGNAKKNMVYHDD